jgi:hypothetical protein
MKARLIFSMIVASALAPQLAQAQGADRLSIHGYLSQGFAIADGGTIFGISEDGTTDYGNAALQFRYALSSNDNVTLQLSHRRSAQSTLIPPDEDAIEIDWAYYGRRFGDFGVKLGRVAIPAGIYNEIRDVGVLLPFYRPSVNLYGEGSFTSEIVDGVVVSYQIGAGSPWSADVSAYGGEWDVTSRSATDEGFVSSRQRATGGLGGWIWVNTPVERVRFGGGLRRYKASLLPGADTWDQWLVSLDASLPTITVQAEITRTTFGMGDALAYYGYVGFRPIPQLTLNAMVDMLDMNMDMATIGLGALDLEYHDEYVIGANYALSPGVVFKLEAHRANGYWLDAPMTNIFMDDPSQVDFLLFSVATAF